MCGRQRNHQRQSIRLSVVDHGELDSSLVLLPFANMKGMCVNVHVRVCECECECECECLCVCVYLCEREYHVISDAL